MKRIVRKIPTPQNLSNVALHYLTRYSASESSLRRILTNRLRRVALENAAFASDKDLQDNLRSVIETIIEKHKALGSINDKTFAETKIHSLRRQGRSARVIKQKLAARGVGRSVIENVFLETEDELGAESTERAAAFIMARRKKLGPYRKQVTSPEQHRKDFATLARAGFSSAVVRQILSGEAEDL